MLPHLPVRRKDTAPPRAKHGTARMAIVKVGVKVGVKTVAFNPPMHQAISAATSVCTFFWRHCGRGAISQ